MKKIVTAIAVATLALTLVSCGGSPDPRQQGSAPVETTTEPNPGLKMYSVEGLDGISKVMCISSTEGYSASISCDWENAQ